MVGLLFFGAVLRLLGVFETSFSDTRFDLSQKLIFM